MAPPKRKVVKHLKKNWKKHSDIADVEDYLEDKRLEERTGGVAAEKKDDQLFFLDSAPPSVPDAAKQSKPLGKKRKIDEPLRCYANLRPDPRVPVANTAQKGEKGKKRQVLAAKRRQADPLLVKRLRAGQKQHAINERKKAATKLADDEGAPITRDLWESEDEGKNSNDDDDDIMAFHNEITKVTRIAVPNSREAMKRKASQFPAVPVPHGGASYNPDLVQYLSHVGAAHKVEEKKLMDEQKLIRELDAKFPDQAEAKKLESNWLVEMSGGLSGEGYADEDEGEEEEEVDGNTKKGAQGVPDKPEKRKTKKQKRKAKEQRTIQQKLTKRKTAKQRAHEFDKLKTISKEISAHEQELSEKLVKKALLQKKREKAGITYRLGQNKYEAMDMEVKLSNELVGDMRSLVPEGNLLEDRYDNMKRRNLVAPGVRQKKGQRKFKLKKQEKRSWRGVTLDDVDVPISSV